jgi:hypothetical protein
MGGLARAPPVIGAHVEVFGKGDRVLCVGDVCVPHAHGLPSLTALLHPYVHMRGCAHLPQRTGDVITLYWRTLAAPRRHICGDEVCAPVALGGRLVCDDSRGARRGGGRGWSPRIAAAQLHREGPHRALRLAGAPIGCLPELLLVQGPLVIVQPLLSQPERVIPHPVQLLVPVCPLRRVSAV